MASTDGAIWSSRSGERGDWVRLRQMKHVDGYRLVGLSRPGRRITKTVHRLILTTFCGECPAGMECRHLDGNPANNHLINLAWGTKKENGADKVKHRAERDQLSDEAT
jgi:hypothetical protein